MLIKHRQHVAPVWF